MRTFPIRLLKVRQSIRGAMDVFVEVIGRCLHLLFDEMVNLIIGQVTYAALVIEALVFDFIVSWLLLLF